ncbi:MAG: transcription antitermination protein NusB [Prochloraceae cyanobacterium]|nr:transcription antitermination protein NusB [Prochloraceae cyanobacterium]
MRHRQQNRSIARELVLLSLCQINSNPEELQKEELTTLISTAIATLRAEIQDNLETAGSEIDNSDALLNSKTSSLNGQKARELAKKLTDKKFEDLYSRLRDRGDREDTIELATILSQSRETLDYYLDLSATVEAAKANIEKVHKLSQQAINRLGYAVELQEFVQLSNQYEVREYSLQLLDTVVSRQAQIQEQIELALVGYTFDRLARVDREILKIAVAEIIYLEIPKKVAIVEAVELAKRYSGEEIYSETDKSENSKGGFRFINGVLRRITDRLKAEAII